MISINSLLISGNNNYHKTNYQNHHCKVVIVSRYLYLFLEKAINLSWKNIITNQYHTTKLCRWIKYKFHMPINRFSSIECWRWMIRKYQLTLFHTHCSSFLLKYSFSTIISMTRFSENKIERLNGNIVSLYCKVWILNRIIVLRE